jgi:hypothetical protein
LPNPAAETLKHTVKILRKDEKAFIINPEGVKIIVDAVVSKKIKRYVVDLTKVKCKT